MTVCLNGHPLTKTRSDGAQPEFASRIHVIKQLDERLKLAVASERFRKGSLSDSQGFVLVLPRQSAQFSQNILAAAGENPAAKQLF